MENVHIVKPPTSFLEAYYALWLKGLENDQLLSELQRLEDGKRYTQAYVKRHLPTIHAFCRQHLQNDTRVSLTNDKRPTMVELTTTRRERLLEYAGLGYPIDKVARLLNVPLVTITELWYKLDGALRDEVEVMRDEYDARVLRAIHRRAIGYELDDDRVAEDVNENLDKEGRLVITKSTRRSHQICHVPGSTTAQKLWAANRFGWTDNPTSASADEERTEYDIRERLYEDDDGQANL
jgi:hypothetical protein